MTNPLLRTTAFPRFVSDSDGLTLRVHEADLAYVDCAPETTATASLEEGDIRRSHFLNQLIAMENSTREACRTAQQRLVTLKHILALNNPMDQLGAYLTFKMDENRNGQDSCDDSRIKSALLASVQLFLDTSDEEAALLGAHFFIGGGYIPNEQTVPTFLLQMAVAAQSNGLSHSI